MKKILVAAIGCLSGLISLTQIQRISDNYYKLHLLKQRLPRLSDTARINCLDSIALGFSFGKFYYDYDSVNSYAIPALEESRRLNYKIGIYTSLIALGNNEARTDLRKSENHLREALLITSSDSITALIKLLLGESLTVQAKYDEAIRLFNDALAFYETKNNVFDLAECVVHLALCYSTEGNFEKAFQYAQRFMTISKDAGDSYDLVFSRLTMADLYMNIADFSAARKYMSEASSFLREIRVEKTWIVRNYLRHLGNLHLLLNQPDSAFLCFNEAKAGYPTAAIYDMEFARIYMAKQEYDKAIPLFEKTRVRSEKKGAENTLMQSLLGLTEAYLKRKNYELSLKFIYQALRRAKERGSKQILAQTYSLLSRIYDSLRKPQEAFAYYKKYIKVNDSLISNQFKAKLSDYKRVADDEKKLAEIDMLRKQKQINEQQLKIQQQQLRQKTFAKNVLIGGLLLVVFLSWFIVRSITLKRKFEQLQNQQLKSHYQQKASQLEMRALRAQMNPHFIFNCLTSINRFILTNETDSASNYLTKFSRLLRMVLMHSQSMLISLKAELEMLGLYLDMEQLRFKQAFKYTIICSDDIDTESIWVPPLLLQPFCENAIWHGLMQKNGQGHLDLELKRDEDLLYCTITDDGIGRQKAAELRTKSTEKQKSLGLKITTERLSLFNQEKSTDASYDIEDIFDTQGKPNGTKVILKIRCKGLIAGSV